MIQVINTVICYNNADEIVEYAQKVSGLVASETIALVIVVNSLNNSSVDKLKESLESIEIEFEIVVPKENLGYMNGMLEGYRYWGQNHNAENLKYIIMSNTDISYPSNLFLEKLLSSDYADDVAVIGPAVYVPQFDTFYKARSTKRRTIREIKKLITIFSIPLLNSLYIKLSAIKGAIKNNDKGISHQVYEVHGCYFVVTRDLADAMVDSPFGALLYSEEAYVAEMARRHKNSVYYDSDLLVEHLEHSVTGKLDYKKLSKYSVESLKVILRDFY